MASGYSLTLKGFKEGLRNKEAHLRAPKISEVGCVLYLPLNRVEAGIVKDLSGQGNHGKVYGAVLKKIGEEYYLKWKGDLIKIGGKALSFDEVDDYVQVPYLDVFNQKQFTIRVWVWSNVTKQNEPIFSIGDEYDTDKYLHCLLRNSKPYLGFWGDDLASTTILELNRWYHLAFVWEGPTTKKQIIYINGKKDCERTSTGLLTVTSGNVTGKGEWIGRFVGDYHGGFISEISVYNRVLSEKEIKEHYELTRDLFK